MVTGQNGIGQNGIGQNGMDKMQMLITYSSQTTQPSQNLITP